MADSIHNEDLLIRYIDGELSAEEKTAVEQRMQTDPSFRDEYLNLKVAVQAIKHLGTMQEVGSIHREMMQELKQSQPAAKVVNMRKTIRYTMAVAASILVLFIGVRLYQHAQLSPDRIYNETFVDFSVANTRSTGNTLSAIETMYQQKAYDKITSSARSLNLSAKDSLLIGLSYLHQENFSSAANWFHALSQTQNEYRQDAEFYLALSYLKMKNYDKALSYMESIHNNPAHMYHEQVSDEAIKKLRKLKKE
jgi:tetratricopeptide (TPR) repeat protein